MVILNIHSFSYYISLTLAELFVRGLEAGLIRDEVVTGLLLAGEVLTEDFFGSVLACCGLEVVVVVVLGVLGVGCLVLLLMVFITCLMNSCSFRNFFLS